jgi:hypothetical protein
LTWIPWGTSGLFPIPATSASGDLGRAIKFTAVPGTDEAAYPNGQVLKLIDESGGNVAVPKDFVVSACPHNFTPANVACINSGSISAMNLYLRYSTSNQPIQSYDCPLQAGGTYYINFRQYATPRTSTVYAQFGIQPRDTSAPPPPSPVACNASAGEVFGGGDADWNPLTSTQIFPSQPLSAPAGSSRAVRFVANAATYPNGLKMTLADQTPALLPKNAVISACPHNFTPVSNNPECAVSNISTFADFYLTFGPGKMWYDCSLTPGQTYYMNYKGTNTNDTVYAQFSNIPR